MTFSAMMSPNATLTSRTASRGDVPCASWAGIISLRPNDSLGWNDHAKVFAGQNDEDDEGYLIPSATRASFPPGLNFLLSSFFVGGAAPPSAASMFLTIATRRGPISLRSRSSVKRNAGAPQLNA